MNPARSAGPAIISGDLDGLWLYISAPIIGASLAAITYQFIRDESPGPPVPASDREGYDRPREGELVRD
jgi:aquaporin Z